VSAYGRRRINMGVKFFPRDVIGKMPVKVGDKFKAYFLTGVHEFTASHLAEGWLMGGFLGRT
jgi:hypothetical protein